MLLHDSEIVCIKKIKRATKIRTLWIIIIIIWWIISTYADINAHIERLHYIPHLKFSVHFLFIILL